MQREGEEWSERVRRAAAVLTESLVPIAESIAGPAASREDVATVFLVLVEKGIALHREEWAERERRALESAAQADASDTEPGR